MGDTRFDCNTVHLNGELADTSFHFEDLYQAASRSRADLRGAMVELLEGMDLERLVLKFGALPSERVVWMLRQLCESLAEAHAAGLIHRDIKPANIVACHLGIEYDYVKVLDFGLVKPAIDTSSLQDGGLSGVNLVQGTPAYLSPEMITGARCDARLDLYGVGCVAYWLLTGELVFKGESTIALALAHAHEQPKPLSERAPHAIPPDLDALVLECLAKQPDDRPASALEVAARFDAIALAEPWSKERAASWWREHLGSRESRSVTDSSARRE